MRLLHTTTGKFKEFSNPRQVRYAILSHVWSTEEQSYEETCQILSNTPSGTTALSRYSHKIRCFCRVASKQGFEWVWIDFSCIMKSSSSELDESINSMYDWYRYAATCYAFLHDLDDKDLAGSNFPQEFGNSKWFTRGWTLQELIASRVLVFLSKNWQVIGSKRNLAALIERVTGIDRSVLTFSRSLESFSIACRMSWAASRTTTRLEDEAYALMGIFGVKIPISYGEGRYAFIRLQEEIVKQYPDQTIFAWGRLLPPYNFEFVSYGTITQELKRNEAPAESLNQYLLASGPRQFKESSTFQPLSRRAFSRLLGLSPERTYQLFTPTAYGMHAYVPLLTIHHDDSLQESFPTHLAILNCEDGDGRLLALLLRPQVASTGRDFHVGGIVGNLSMLLRSDTPLTSYFYRATYLTREQVTSLRRSIEMIDIYLPHRPSIAAQKSELDETTHAALRDSREHFEVRLAGWSRALLERYGFTVLPEDDRNVASPDGRLVLSPASTTSAIVLIKNDGSEHITVRVGRCNCNLADSFHLLAVMVSSRGRSSDLEHYFQSPHYEKDNPAHIQSWLYSGGFASTEIDLHSSTEPTITLCLTFGHDTQFPPDGTHAKVYRLGVDIVTTPVASHPFSSSPTPMDSPYDGPSHPRLDTTIFRTPTIPIGRAANERVQTYSEAAASPPTSDAVIVKPASRTTLPPGWLGGQSQQGSRPAAATSNGAPRPQQRPHAPESVASSRSRGGLPSIPSQPARGSHRATDPGARRPSSVNAPPPQAIRSASSGPWSGAGSRPPTSQSRYNGAVSGASRKIATNGSSISRAPSTARQPSTRASSPGSVISDVFELDENVGEPSRATLWSGTNGHSLPLSPRDQQDTYLANGRGTSHGARRAVDNRYDEEGWRVVGPSKSGHRWQPLQEED